VLEEPIRQDGLILNLGWLLIGRQLRMGVDKLIDLLALDASGTVIIIELQRAMERGGTRLSAIAALGSSICSG